MANTANINLGGTDYTVHIFNIDEWERVSDAFLGPKSKIPFALLRTAMERAEPAADVSKLEVTTGEVAEAVLVIMALTGLDQVAAA